MQILIVDDDADMREATSMLLNTLGYRAGTAESADRAMSILGSTPSVRVLLTDVVMPGMNGFELARKAKAMLPHLRVIYMTGYSRDGLPDAAELLGPLMTKPWDVDRMLEEIENCA